MNNETPVVKACLDIIKDNPGISINGVMSKIGEAHGGPKTFTNNQVFSGVQFLKTSGAVKPDERVKKNQGLYLKDEPLPADPVKVSFRKAPSARVSKQPRYQIRKKDGEGWNVIESNDNEDMLKAYLPALKKNPDHKGAELEIHDTQAEAAQEPAEATA